MTPLHSRNPIAHFDRNAVAALAVKVAVVRHTKGLTFLKRHCHQTRCGCLLDESPTRAGMPSRGSDSGGCWFHDATVTECMHRAL